MAMDYKGILKKPFLVTTVTWPTTAAAKTELTRIAFPSAILSNPLAGVPFNSSLFYRAKMCVKTQVAGTPMHQGVLCAAILPHGNAKIVDLNSILPAPHAFLFANETTCLCLPAPFYKQTTVSRTSVQPNDYLTPYGSDIFDLVFFVVNPLGVATGALNSISLSVNLEFESLDFYVPKLGNMTFQAQGASFVRSKCACIRDVGCACDVTSDHKLKSLPKFSRVQQPAEAQSLMTELLNVPTQILDRTATGLKTVVGDVIDMGREYIQKLTGFHNPNISHIDEKMIPSYRNYTNNVDIPSRMEVMDNHGKFSRIYDDVYFRTVVDEMDLKHILAKPCYLGTFAINTTDPVGKNLMAYPITPFTEISLSGPQNLVNQYIYSPVRKIYESSRYWRGRIKMYIQVCATNFHCCKIIVLRNYEAKTDMATKVPAYNNIHNINTDTIEISGGGQAHQIDLDYCSAFKQLECTKDVSANAINHGMVYIYLAQPLVTNGAVPTTMYVNVYYSFEDVEFSGYNVDTYSQPQLQQPVYPPIPNFANGEAGVYFENGYIPTSQYKEILRTKKRDQYQQHRTLDQKWYLSEDTDSLTDLEFILSRSLPKLKGKAPWYILIDGDQKEIQEGCKTEPEDLTTVFTFTNFNNKSIAGISKSKEPVKHSPADREPIPTEFSAQSQDGPIDGSVQVEQSQVQRKDDQCKSTTIIKSSDQCHLVNHSKIPNPELGMSFQPNVSIRDYIRIFQPLDIYSLPGSAKAYINFPVSNLISGVGTLNCTGNMMLSAMFWGFTGGYKFKFRVTNASIFYAQYFPPGTYLPTTGITLSPTSVLPTNIETNVQTNTVAKIGVLPSIMSWSAPQIELQDYSRPMRSASFISNASVIEMAIPNMNQNDFTGGCSRQFGFNTVESDLGSIVIGILPASDGSFFAQSTIQPYCAFNDETRLGFHVFSPPVQLNTLITTSGALVRDSAFNTPTTDGSFITPGSIPMQNPLMKATYYFKPT
jgi:hypothetical protein